MFNEVGKEIKRMAEKHVISAVIPFVIIAIAVFALLASKGYALVGLIAAIIIILIKYLNARKKVILLYGYGELIDRVCSIDDHLSGSTPSLISTVNPQLSTKDPANTTHISSGSGWTCSCGRKNANYVSTCSCGINKRDLSK